MGKFRNYLSFECAMFNRACSETYKFIRDNLVVEGILIVLCAIVGSIIYPSEHSQWFESLIIGLSAISVLTVTVFCCNLFLAPYRTWNQQKERNQELESTNENRQNQAKIVDSLLNYIDQGIDLKNATVGSDIELDKWIRQFDTWKSSLINFVHHRISHHDALKLNNTTTRIDKIIGSYNGKHNELRNYLVKKMEVLDSIIDVLRNNVQR